MPNPRYFPGYVPAAVIVRASVPGRTYRVERSDTLGLGTWETMLDNIPGTGNFIQTTDTGGANRERRFYRITVAR